MWSRRPIWSEEVMAMTYTRMLSLFFVAGLVLLAAFLLPHLGRLG